MNLHLGCWHRNIPGFVNVDLCEYDHIHYRSSIDSLPFINDNSVDLIYSSHSFEYFSLEEAPRVLKEWHRVLKPGGVLRLAVPDFEGLLRVYQQCNDITKILGPIYGRMKINEGDSEINLYHKVLYDFSLLSSVLVDGGFERIERYDWRETIHKDFDDHSQAYFPHMDKENGILISLNIEAIAKK